MESLGFILWSGIPVLFNAVCYLNYRPYFDQFLYWVWGLLGLSEMIYYLISGAFNYWPIFYIVFVFTFSHGALRFFERENVIPLHRYHEFRGRSYREDQDDRHSSDTTEILESDSESD